MRSVRPSYYMGCKNDVYPASADSEPRDNTKHKQKHQAVTTNHKPNHVESFGMQTGLNKAEHSLSMACLLSSILALEQVELSAVAEAVARLVAEVANGTSI